MLFDRFDLLDVFGPLELLGVLSDRFELRMIGPTADPVRSAQGPEVLAADSSGVAGLSTRRRASWLRRRPRPATPLSPAGRDLRVAVPLRQELSAEVEDLFRQLPPLNVTRMFPNTCDMAEAALAFVRAMFTAEDVDPRLREILTPRTAWILNVPDEWEANVPTARNVRVTDADITSVATDGPVTGLDATANLICQATYEITKDVAVSDTTLQHMLDVFGPTLTTKYTSRSPGSTCSADSSPRRASRSTETHRHPIAAHLCDVGSGAPPGVARRPRPT